MSDPIIDTLSRSWAQFEGEPRSDWSKANKNREVWGWSLCPCGLMFYVERECGHGADLLARADRTPMCEANECDEEADWLLIARKRNSHAHGYDFRRYELCDIHAWPELDAHTDAGWECLTPELF